MDDFTSRYLQAGQTSIANYLLDHFKEVGMTTDQLLVYLQLRRFMDRGDQLPEGKVVAQPLGWDPQRVYQLLHEMVTQKLMTITTAVDAQGQNQDSYDFHLLAEKLSQLPVHQATAAATPTVATPAQKAVEPSERAQVFNQIEREFGRPLSPIELETINDWLKLDHYKPELIQLALKEAVLNQAYSLKYMERILINWGKKNIQTAAQVQKEHERQSDRQAPASGQNGPDPAIPDIPIFKLTD